MGVQDRAKTKTNWATAKVYRVMGNGLAQYVEQYVAHMQSWVIWLQARMWLYNCLLSFKKGQTGIKTIEKKT